MGLKYSVLMSVYAKEKPEYFRLALESMINQTAKPDEIIIVQDGPVPQELSDAIIEYSKCYPDLIRMILSEKNIGLGLALNLGLQNCRNDLIARMDTDDISKPDRCEKQLKRFEERPDLAIVGAWVDEFSCTIEHIISTRVLPTESGAIYKFAKRRSAFNHPVVMYKKSKVLENGGYGSMRRNQDVDLFGRMLFSGCIGENIGESLLWFRCDNELAKRRKSWSNIESYIITINNFRRIGYSNFWDLTLIAVTQIIMFIMPIRFQHFFYKFFIRKCL